MSLNRWNLLAAPALTLGLAMPFLANCKALGNIVPGMSCDELDNGNFAALKFEGDASVQGKLKGFLEAVYNLDKLAADAEVGLIASCAELGKAAGLPEAELKADPSGGEGAKKVCFAVAAKIENILKGGVTLSVEVKEPKCYADVDAMMKCFGECGATIKPGELDVACEGGKISGECKGECKGSCTLEAGAKCEGSCGGSCEGKCDGKESHGSCAGKCDGTCSGSCTVTGKAECSGSCEGGCSVDVKAPKCSGTFKPPSVSVECQTSCGAKAAASFKCDPPGLSVTLEGKAADEVKALAKGLEVALPKIIDINVRLGKKLAGTIEGVVKMGAELPSVAANAGTKAIGCIGAAVDMAASASGSIGVSVSASVKVSGSVGASM
ncbi:MAG: hypothetical protein HY908_22100 [Myxococcales bacterium]|nr:hypothetical protein [Myxococcales bacterium]